MANGTTPSGRSSQNVVIPGEVPGRDEQQGQGQQQQQQPRPQARAQPSAQPSSQQQAPQSDPDFDRRKQGFKNIFSRLTQTPEGRLALLQAGVSLSQGHGLGTAIGRGANTAIRAKQNEAEAAQSARESTLEARKTESEIAENEAQTREALAGIGVDEARQQKLGAETLTTLSELRGGGAGISAEKRMSAYQDLLQSNMEGMRESAALSGDMDEQEMLDQAIRTTNSQWQAINQSVGQEASAGGQQGGGGEFDRSTARPVRGENGDPLIVERDGRRFVAMEDARGNRAGVPVESLQGQ